MATYKVGKVKISATGLMTGVGTNWTAANALVRVGATVVLATNPVRIYTVGTIISATSIQLSDWGSDAAITADTGYAILLHDGLTVQGLAQDTAETLRYYRNFEQTLGDASKMQVGEQPGQLMQVGAFGLGGNKPGGTMGSTLYATANDLMKDLAVAGNGWWRAQGVSEAGMGIFGHGSGFNSYTGDTLSAINVEYTSGRLIVLADTKRNIDAGLQPRRNAVFGTANPPDLNNETRGVLSLTKGGTGAATAAEARKNLAIGIYELESTGSANRTWINIATLTDPGQSASFKQFIVAGANGIGNPRMDMSLVTISSRGITANFDSRGADEFITHKVLAGNSYDGSNTVKFGITKRADGAFELWAQMLAFNDRARFTLMATNGGAIKGFINGDTESPARVTTEPTGIVYATQVVAYDKTTTENIAIKARGYEARYTPGDANVIINKARIRCTFGNGNLVLGTSREDPPEGSSEAPAASIYIRQAGHMNGKIETQFMPDGNVRSTGQFNGSSDVRLKKDFAKIDSPLEAMMSFRGATFTMINSGSREVGIIAQDINEKCPAAIKRFETEVGDEHLSDAMAVNSAGFAAAYSVEAIKEVVKLMDLMLKDPEAAKARIEALKEMINDKLPE